MTGVSIGPLRSTFVELRTGCKKNVPIIGYAGSLQMRMTEPINNAVAVVVSATTIPASESGVRAQLDHSKWGRRTRVRVTVPSRSYEGVYKAMQGGRSVIAPDQTNERKDKARTRRESQ